MAAVHVEAEMIPWRIGRADGERWVAHAIHSTSPSKSETWAELMEDIGLTLDAMLRDLLSS